MNISNENLRKFIPEAINEKTLAVAARTVYSVAILVLTTAILTIGVLLTYAVTFSRDKAYWFIKLWARALVYFYRVKLTVIGADHVDFGRTNLYVTNHRSAADIPILMSAIGARISFVSKKELKSIPFLGWSMRAVDMVFIDRGNTESAIASIKEAAAQVRSGVNVIIFPEGHRSENGKTMRPFKKGAFHLALEAGVPIQPALITGSEKIMSKHSLAVYPGEAVVRFGQPIPVTPQDTVESLMEKTRAELERLRSMENDGAAEQ